MRNTKYKEKGADFIENKHIFFNLIKSNDVFLRYALDKSFY